MKNLKYLVLVTLIVSATSAWAHYYNYGQGGCGLGSMAFGHDREDGSQILAMTTNGTFFNQTFGISSGTSNCTPDAKVSKATEFINNNMAALEVDMARGEGETLSSLSAIMGCKEDASFGKSLQKYYGHIFDGSENDSIRIYHSLNKLTQYDSQLSNLCAQVI